MNDTTAMNYSVNDLVHFVGRTVTIHRLDNGERAEGTGLCVDFHKTESGIDVELSNGSRYGFSPEHVGHEKITGTIFNMDKREVRIVPFKKLTTEQATEMARRIVKSSTSADEIRRRLGHVGFNGDTAAIMTQSCGSTFMAMAMIHGPKGEIISV